MKKYFKVITIFLFFFGLPEAFAAIGCDLNDPVRDVARLFPGSSGYKMRYASITELGGEPLLKKIKERLGGNSKVLFAPIDVPYTIYEVYNGSTKLGYIHGVNQKGQYGGTQVFIVQDLNGTIKNFYIQKISGPAAAKFRNRAFGVQFIGMSVKDFVGMDASTCKGTGRITKVVNPAPEAKADFLGIMRGLKKNLILMDEFVFSAGAKK